VLKPYVLHTSCTLKKLNAYVIYFETIVYRIGFSIKLYVSFRNDAIISLAMKNIKKIFFLRLVYLTLVKRRNCLLNVCVYFLKLSFVSISMCIINVLKPALIFN